MTLFKDKYRTQSARLQGWDYASTGWYFVTICTRNKVCCFGEVMDGEIHLSPAGEIVAHEWNNTSRVRPSIRLDQWVVMPNHLHGIIAITNDSKPDDVERGAQQVFVETRRWHVSRATPSPMKKNSLPAIIAQFKSTCTKRIWTAGFRDFAWQERFYDHVIRNTIDLDRIRQYILDNPLKWEIDREQVANPWI